MKLACVIQRFGSEITGGSERHCQAIAEHLAAAHDVTIVTTCAQDHLTWRNVYPPGASRLGPLQILRFPVARPRRMQRFADISRTVLTSRSSTAEQEEWFRENGPEVPELLAYLDRHGAEYDRILFWTYRYYPAFFGLPRVADRAILVPTAEEDPLIRIEVLDRFFSLPAGYLFLTPEEKNLVARRSSRPLPVSAVIGCGIDLPGSPPPLDVSRHGIVEPFVLYLGRIDRNKGCDAMLENFERYSNEQQRPLQLVMAGSLNLVIPSSPRLKWLGVVDDVLRDGLLSRARVLLMPSPFESLSMVLLEAWTHGTPALVNGRCSVLKGQVRRADGGLHYSTYAEFAAGLTYLLDHADVARTLGAQGREYVAREYAWPNVMQKIEGVLT